MTVPADVPAAASPAEPALDRRGLVKAVLVCALGAGLVLFAVTRTWTETETRRPAPLPPVTEAHTGSSLHGWITALALVALAGAGALLATRGAARILTGALLGLVGLVLAGGGIEGLTEVSGDRIIWPALVIVGGFAVVWSGMQAMRYGPSWPAMGARYERPATGAPAPGDRRRPTGPATDATMWDDLDQGIDPTDPKPH